MVVPWGARQQNPLGIKRILVALHGAGPLLGNVPMLTNSPAFGRHFLRPGRIPIYRVWRAQGCYAEGTGART